MNTKYKIIGLTYIFQIFYNKHVLLLSTIIIIITIIIFIHSYSPVFFFF